MTADLDRLKASEKLKSDALKKAEERLEHLLESENKYRDVLRRSKVLERNRADLEEVNASLREDVVELKKFLDDVCCKELTIRQELEDALQRVKSLEEEIDSMRGQAVDAQKENEVS